MVYHRAGRRPRWYHSAVATPLALGVLLVLFASGAEATPRQPVVVGTFTPEYTTARLGDHVDVVLHLFAGALAPQVEVQFTLPPQVRPVTGSAPWVGALAQNQTVDLPLTLELVQEGEYSIVATVKSGAEWAKATLNVVATAQGVFLGTTSINGLKRRAGLPLPPQPEFIEAPANPVPAPPSKPITPQEQNLNQFFRDLLQKQQAATTRTPAENLPLQAASADSTLSGHMNWLDKNGGAHPIRYAHVQILDGHTGDVLQDTMTDATGFYSTNITATLLQVRVISEDFLGGQFVKVHAPLVSSGLGGRYAYVSGTTPIGEVVDITTDKPIIGSPAGGDAIQARAFSVFDALMQYQVQAYGLRGAFMPQAGVLFPCEDAVFPPCGITAYNSGLNVFLILREDALDWDVLGHEFIHFLTQKGAGRTVDDSSGGFHTGGSAIGQPTTQGGTDSRNRDAGMRLAWSEGLATFLAVRLKGSPASTAFGMTWPSVPCSLSSPCTSHYQDSEDQAVDDDLENMPSTQGYGSEHSIAQMFWLYTDPQPPGGPGQTGKFGLSANTIWNLINQDLACNPCDRVDRFWNGVVQLLNGGPLLAQVAQTLVLANIAPALSAPDDGSLVSAGVSPTFQWNANGDPSPDHNSNSFFLVVSKDNFQSDFHIFPTNNQPIQLMNCSGNGLTCQGSYQIPDEDYRTLVQGATGSTVFSWAVLGYRAADADIRIPEGDGHYWVSNARTFKVKAFHIQMDWDVLGADVDLHFRPPDGASFVGSAYPNDCAYYNRNPDWGVQGDPSDNPSLDRDCITDCTEENISIDKITTPGTYKILAHYFSDHGMGPTTVRIQVFQGGTVLFDDTHTLNATGDLWEALTFTIAPSGKVEASAGAGPVTTLTPPVNLPRFMLKKQQ